MKASHELLMKLAELGILRSMPDFLGEPLKPGRLRGRFMEIEFIVDNELKRIFADDPNVYKDNILSITAYLEKFSKIMNADNLAKEDIHVASVVCFCMSFLDTTKTKYPEKLYEYLKDIIDYYERADKIKHSDFMKGRTFHEEWELVSDTIGD